jgi:hypothetical protein
MVISVLVESENYHLEIKPFGERRGQRSKWVAEEDLAHPAIQQTVVGPRRLSTRRDWYF